MVPGIANLGNTCYFNTAVQCLAHCPGFVSLMKSTDGVSKTSLVSQLKDVVGLLWESDTQGIMPRGLLGAVKESIPSLYIHEENDIQEFLVLLIDRLNTAMKCDPPRPPRFDEEATTTKPWERLKAKVDAAWHQSHAKDYSPLVDMFHGQSISQVMCGNCGKIFHNYEPFTTLCVPLGADTVTGCLERYLDHEHVNAEGEDACWKCDACKQSPKSLKSTKFWRLPEVLMLVVKRFTPTLQKNHARLGVDRVLNVRKYSLGPSPHNTYDLCAIACHSGSYGSGHYHAICRRPGNKWYVVDDVHVNDVPAPETSRNGYVFFYQRRRGQSS
jgi:ubiquitin C-terminal hydrolase